jgi:hypothetical protein
MAFQQALRDEMTFRLKGEDTKIGTYKDTGFNLYLSATMGRIRPEDVVEGRRLSAVLAKASEALSTMVLTVHDYLGEVLGDVGFSRWLRSSIWIDAIDAKSPMHSIKTFQCYFAPYGAK